MDRSKACRAQLVDFIGEESPFRTNRQANRDLRLRRKRGATTRMRHQVGGAATEYGQLILDKRAEARTQMDMRQDSIASLLKSQKQLFMQLWRRQQRTSPVAFIDPITVDQVTGFYPDTADGAQDSAQHLWSRQRQNQRHRQRRRR